MNRFYAVATDVLVNTNAFIGKLVGDEVIGIYLPIFTGANHACPATDAAMELLRATGHGLLNAGSIWSHANLQLPGTLDRLLRMVIVTPDMHRVHHSIDRVETDSNFGFTLSWWDHLLGTYRAQPKMGHEAMVVGVAGFAVGDVLGLGRLLVQPMVRQPDTPSDPGARHRSEERSQGLTGRKS